MNNLFISLTISTPISMTIGPPLGYRWMANQQGINKQLFQTKNDSNGHLHSNLISDRIFNQKQTIRSD